MNKLNRSNQYCVQWLRQCSYKARSHLHVQPHMSMHQHECVHARQRLPCAKRRPREANPTAAATPCMLEVEPPPLLPKTAILWPPVGVRVSTTTENLRRLKRVEKCGAVEQARVSRRAEHARAIYQGRDNYRALTCPTRSAFGDHGWAPCAPARPEALLAVQTVHLAHIGEYLVSHSHYVTTASTWLTRRPWFNERCGHTLIQRRPRSTNLCYSSLPNRCHGMSFEHGGVKQESVGNWPGPLSMVKKPKLELSSTNLSGVAVSSSSCSMWWKGEGVKLEGRCFGKLGRKGG